MRTPRNLTTIALANCLAMGTIGAVGTSAHAATAPIRIDAGSTTSVTAAGVTWAADRNAIGGSTSSRGNFAGDPLAAVLPSVRYGMSGYSVPVPNGDYTVSLVMAETFHQAAGKRVFHVNLEGSRVLTSLDVFAAAGGLNRSLVRAFDTKVSDGRVDLAFAATVDHATISGIVITPKTTSVAPTPAPVATAAVETRVAQHVDAGAATGSAAGGITWSKDSGFVGGTVSSNAPVAGAVAPGVYGRIRHGMSGYALKVPSGSYDVTLRMAETWHKARGQRVFDVNIEGSTVLSSFDVFAAAGGWARPVDRTFRTTVTDGLLNIDYRARVDRATVSGISVAPVPAVSASPVPTPTPTSTPTPAPTSTSPAPTPAPTATQAPTPTASTAPIAGPALPSAAAGYPFSNSSVWRQSVRSAPLHPRSAGLVQHLNTSITSRYNGVATFNVWDYNSSYYVVDGNKTPRTTVKFHNCQNKPSTPSGLYDGEKHFVSVPIPSGAVPAQGTDAALVIYSPTTDQLWELWVASNRADGWYACWGGRMDRVSTNIGHFNGNWGTTATGLPHAAAQISLADVRSGSINHAMGLILAEPATYKLTSWPAQRSDGWSTHPDAVPEGLRLRLDPSVDVDKLNLHPVAKMIAKSAQTYGFIVVDKAGATGVYTESGIPEKQRTGTDPWKGILSGTPSYEVMRNFPWGKLQAMPMHYGKP